VSSKIPFIKKNIRIVNKNVDSNCECLYCSCYATREPLFTFQLSRVRVCLHFKTVQTNQIEKLYYYHLQLSPVASWCSFVVTVAVERAHLFTLQLLRACTFVYIFGTAQLAACLRDLARHFKTEPTETVAFCFGIPVSL
jgi:hypothetical protein